MKHEPLLTISIPTYNRSFYLDRILTIIQDQYSPEIELIVSDNCSTDETQKIVEKFLQKKLPIRYFKNESNLGPDLNVAQCYYEAKGKYVLVFGDDDIFLPGAIKKILKILREGEFGLVFLNYYGFSNNYIKEAPRSNFFRKFYLFKKGDIFVGVSLKISTSPSTGTEVGSVGDQFPLKSSWSLVVPVHV